MKKDIDNHQEDLKILQINAQLRGNQSILRRDVAEAVERERDIIEREIVSSSETPPEVLRELLQTEAVESDDRSYRISKNKLKKLFEEKGIDILKVIEEDGLAGALKVLKDLTGGMDLFFIHGINLEKALKEMSMDAKIDKPKEIDKPTKRAIYF